MKDNKLLAEYLGEYHKQKTTFIRDDILYFGTGICNAIKWQPDKDWNQLMMVVEKIEEEPFIYVEIGGGECRIKYYDEYQKGHERVVRSGAKIEAVYNACVEYIKK